MVTVAGEGAKYWPRWRGPSGQGYVAPGQVRQYLVDSTATSSGALPCPAPETLRPSSGAIASTSRRRRTTARSSRCSRSAARTASCCGSPSCRSKASSTSHPKNGHASATPVTDGTHDLRVLRAARAGRLRHDRQDRLAPEVRADRQLPRSGRLAGALQRSRLPLSGSRGLGGAEGLRRGVRCEDRQDDVGDAANANRRVGHAGRDQHGRTRRARRQQPAACDRLRSR